MGSRHAGEHPISHTASIAKDTKSLQFYISCQNRHTQIRSLHTEQHLGIGAVQEGCWKPLKTLSMLSTKTTRESLGLGRGDRQINLAQTYTGMYRLNIEIPGMGPIEWITI